MSRTKGNNRLHIAFTVICGLVGIGSVFSKEMTSPKLVVGIMVDQLRSDYLENLRDLFGEKGFNRLFKEGAYLQDVDFKVPDLDKVSATAIVYTGNYPRYNGITSSKVYNPAAKNMVFALNDPNVIGNFTSETFSPLNLRLSTISDELAVATGGDGRIYSIAPDAQQAVVMAGHAGNSAFWINDNTGNWATTTYYLDNPQLLTQRNYTYPVASRLDTMVWRPLRPSAAEPIINKKKQKNADFDFSYTFPRADKDVFRKFSASPMGNEEVTSAAVAYLEELNLGSRGRETEMINLAYTAAPFNYGTGENIGSELEDTYLRLDGQLGRLFDAIDKNIGLDNVVIYLSSTGYYDDQTGDAEKFRLPSGNFSVKRALSLLNSYLSAHYGNGAYVDTYHDGHVYLNHKELENRNIDIRAAAELARDFLVKMSGINDAFTMTDIMNSSLPSMEGLRLATDPKTGGDIILEFCAGWTVNDDTVYPVQSKIERSKMAMTPAFFMGAGIMPETIEKTVEATAIAPTIAKILRIRSPNGTASKPVLLKMKE